MGWGGENKVSQPLAILHFIGAIILAIVTFVWLRDGQWRQEPPGPKHF